MSPSRVIAVAATARSGSTLLAQGLGATGQAGDPKEWFNPIGMYVTHQSWGVPRIAARGHAERVVNAVRRKPNWKVTHRFTRASLVRYLNELGEHTTTPNGVMSFKTMWGQYHQVLLRHHLDARFWGVDVQWVRTQRIDRVRQAVSTLRAVQTNAWTAQQSVRATPRYDADRIAAHLKGIERAEQHWDGHFASEGVAPLTVTYETLDSDYEGVMAGVLDHLGIDAPVPPRQLTRQGDALNDEWVERFSHDRPGA